MNNGISRVERKFFLSEILGNKVLWNGKKAGKLDDLVIVERGVAPLVTHVVVSRPYGHKSLVVPFAKVAEFSEKSLTLDIESVEQYERSSLEGLSLLNDHVMDKKIVDMEDHEVEMVYDIKLAYIQHELFVTDVDCSRYSFLRRIGLSRLANFINSMAATLKDETISWKYVQPLSGEMGSFTGKVKLKVLKDNLKEIHPMDLADILEEMNHEDRLAVFNALDDEQASDTLEEIEPRVQRDIISSIGEERAADLIEDMTPAQAADVLSVLPAVEADEIIALMETELKDQIESLMDEHEKNILDLATKSFVSFPPETKVEDLYQQYKEVARDKDLIWYIYVVSDKNKLLGIVNFHELLRSGPNQLLQDIMNENVKSLKPASKLDEAADMFDKYFFRALPIVDDESTMLGVVSYRDVKRLEHRFV